MTVQKIVKYNQQDGELEFKLNVLEDSGNYLIHRDILRHQLSQKQGTVATKTRSEVRGGGKKPWQQKGTGRARAGSSRSPLWRGGGVIFGPKPKTTSLKLNKKERKLAVQTLLYNKVCKADLRSFLFNFNLVVLGFGPKITPPPLHSGERLDPARALPVPFCCQGFLPPPRTSLLVFVATVPCFCESWCLKISR